MKILRSRALRGIWETSSSLPVPARISTPSARPPRSRYGTADTTRTLLPSVPSNRAGRNRLTATPEDLVAAQSLEEDLVERDDDANGTCEAISARTPLP